MKFAITFFLMVAANMFSQSLQVNNDYFKIHAAADDPLYTTYTAAMERSRLYGDKGYKMDYYSDCYPVSYSGDQAGKFYCIWKINQVVVTKIENYHKKPVVTASFPDMAILEYEPFKGIQVQETFFVYSSSVAIISMQIKNTDDQAQEVEIYPVLELGNDSLLIKKYDSSNYAYITNHHESKYRLISSLYKNAPYPTETRDFFCGNFKPYSYGGYSGDMDQFYIKIKTDYYSDNRSDSLNLKDSGYVNFIALHSKFILKPGEEVNRRYFRGWQDQKEGIEVLTDQINKLKQPSLQPFADEDVELYSKIPIINFDNEDEKLVYFGAFNLVRGCMLPPTESAKHNFYVFSREPLWGWGHGHQVLHESLSMLAYAYMDPKSAEGSQRVYIDQQRKDGLIAYRHGPRGLQDYPHYSKELGKDMSTTSAPFFSWENWEIYKVSKDKEFLQDAYKSGEKYVKWLEENRDTDNDGLYEWGPYGIIENVRDWYNVVFQVSKERHLDVDKEDISDELEDLDLSLMVVKEMKSLALMADAMGDKSGKEKWSDKAEKISRLINKYMWDDSTGFYYHIDKKNHSFKFLTRDLKHKEIIGLLALWAGAAPDDRAERLVEHLTNPDEFWRKYGVPTLSADDQFYSPYVDYCCKWNGPVWLLWDYLIIDGLHQYGYKKIADKLSDKMTLAVVTQLRKNHNYWESYSPDNDIMNSPSNYIWDSIMARVLIDKYGKSR